MASYKEDLDKLSCGECANGLVNTPIYFHTKCHASRPTWVKYYNGEIEVICSVCEKVIATIAVAERGE